MLETPTYVAISYTWGEPGGEGVVNINGVPHQVRRNLWEFLIILRSRWQNVCIWVDALCIKQDDPLEKGQQVQMIGRIFRNARRVSIWLGESSSYTKMYFCAASIAPTKPGEAYGLGRAPRIEKWPSFGPQEREALRMALAELLRRPYWTRAWIIQECISNQELVLHSGQYTATWKQFAELSYEIWIHTVNQQHWTRDLEIAWHNYRSIERCRNGLGSRGFDLHTLRDFHPRACVDKRDTIYAFMELLEEAKPRNSARLTVDYTISMATLYIRACHAHFSTSQVSYTKTLRELRDDLMLSNEDLDTAIRAVIDPKELFLPLRYFETLCEGIDNKPFSLRPNHQDPDREYNINELYAADFETLATGTLKDGGRRLPPPRWWDSMLQDADSRGIESCLLTYLWPYRVQRRCPSSVDHQVDTTLHLPRCSYGKHREVAEMRRRCRDDSLPLFRPPTMPIMTTKRLVEQELSHRATPPSSPTYYHPSSPSPLKLPPHHPLTNPPQPLRLTPLHHPPLRIPTNLTIHKIHAPILLPIPPLLHRQPQPPIQRRNQPRRTPLPSTLERYIHLRNRLKRLGSRMSAQLSLDDARVRCEAQNAVFGVQSFVESDGEQDIGDLGLIVCFERDIVLVLWVGDAPAAVDGVVGLFGLREGVVGLGEGMVGPAD